MSDLSKTQVKSPSVEPLSTSQHHLLCWKSVLAGVLIAFMAYLTLTALGAGIGGLTLENMIHHERGGNALATSAGLWMGLSAVISLFAGTYFALRISKYVTTKVGAAHGFVIASVFFILMLMGAGSVVGGLTMGLGRVVEGVGQGTGALSANPVVQDTFNKALSSTNLKSPPDEVAQGLAARLLQGDLDSARAYYAYQTGMTQAEADARINQLQADFTAAAKTAGERAARGIADTGWALFVLFLVGMIASVVGGRVGAHANVARPFAVLAERESERYPIDMIPAH